MLKQISLTTKVVLVSAAVTVAAMTATVATVTSQGNAIVQSLAVKEGRQLSERYAAATTGSFRSAIATARSLADTVVALERAGNHDRQFVNAVLRQTSETHPDLFNVWIGFEADGFGKDAEHVGQPGMTAQGRFLNSWFKRNGAVSSEVWADFDESKEAYWAEPKRLRQPVVLEPYTYAFNGKDVLLTSVTVPIVVDGRFLGVVGVDYDLTTLSKDMNAIHPYETGNVYLISNGGLWVAYPDEKAQGQPIDKTNANLAEAKARIARGEGFDETRFSNTIKANVQRVFTPVAVDGTGKPWSLLVSMPEDRLLAPVATLRNAAAAAGGVGLLTLVGALALVGRGMIGRPMRRTIASVDALIRGDLDAAVADSRRGDEIGQFNRALETFRENARRMAALEAERRADERRHAEQRRHDLTSLADGFEASVRSVVRAVADAAVRLKANAHTMQGAAAQTLTESAAVAALGEETSATVTTVAASTEELSVSIGEISRQVEGAAAIAREAHGETQRTNAAIAELADTASRIGAVVTLIQGIAEQTNLLALNATIEAARAGEAGKGFAVVAQEVKALATQTRKATDDVSVQIGDVQSRIGSSVTSLRAIGGVVDRMNQIAATIAAAVEQQASATDEIARNVQQASNGATAVSRTIAGVRAAAGAVSTNAADVMTAAGSLATQSDTLTTEVDRFIARIRSDD